MIITHCISSINKNSGGTSTYLKLLLESLNGKVDQNLVTTASDSNLQINAEINYFLLAANKMSSVFKKLETNLFHGNGLWELPVHFMAQSASRRNIPYIISTHGMLEPWSLTQSTFKKKLALFLFQHKDLKQATCLHATGQMEVESIRNLGYTNPIANIPNGINLVEFPLKDFSVIKSKKTVLFLSRIHPKKGIEILIESWSLIDTQLRDNWSIEIAGNGDAKYIKSLNNLIAFKGLDHEIKIVGSKFGADKINTYHNADLFVLPTYSENFGIVVAEALACGIPVITTQGTPWESLLKTQSGWWINIGAPALKVALEEALQMPSKTLQQMGYNGRKLVEEKYSIQAVARQMMALYEWVINGNEKPKFIDFYKEN